MECDVSVVKILCMKITQYLLLIVNFVAKKRTNNKTKELNNIFPLVVILPIGYNYVYIKIRIKFIITIL